MHGARRGQSLWDAWNDAESADDLQVAMNLLAVVRRDRAFSREVVRAFGMTRTSQRRTTRTTKATPTKAARTTKATQRRRAGRRN
jgi:hypothetical protein